MGARSPDRLVPVRLRRPRVLHGARAHERELRGAALPRAPARRHPVRRGLSRTADARRPRPARSCRRGDGAAASRSSARLLPIAAASLGRRRSWRARSARTGPSRTSPSPGPTRAGSTRAASPTSPTPGRRRPCRSWTGARRSPGAGRRAAVSESGSSALIVPWWIAFWGLPDPRRAPPPRAPPAGHARVLICHNVDDHEATALHRFLALGAFLAADAFFVHSE